MTHRIVGTIGDYGGTIRGLSSRGMRDISKTILTGESRLDGTIGTIGTMKGERLHVRAHTRTHASACGRVLSGIVPIVPVWVKHVGEGLHSPLRTYERRGLDGTIDISRDSPLRSVGSPMQGVTTWL